MLDYVSGVIQQHYLTKKNKYLPIEVEDAYKIKQILKTCQLEEEIVLNEKQSVKLLGEIAEVGEEGYCCSLITGKNNEVLDELLNLDILKAIILNILFLRICTTICWCFE